MQAAAEFVRAFRMKDANDRVIYDLFFATNNAKGNQKMKEAMWRTDPSGTFSFSDATNPGQRVLFGSDWADTRALFALLLARFGTQPVAAATVKQFVLDETPFLGKHTTQTLKWAEDKGGVTVEGLRADGTKRARGTFPNHVQLHFTSVSDRADTLF